LPLVVSYASSVADREIIERIALVRTPSFIIVTRIANASKLLLLNAAGNVSERFQSANFDPWTNNKFRADAFQPFEPISIPGPSSVANTVQFYVRSDAKVMQIAEKAPIAEPEPRLCLMAACSRRPRTSTSRNAKQGAPYLRSTIRDCGTRQWPGSDSGDRNRQAKRYSCSRSRSLPV
jgi:hypothetical protein